MYIFLVVRIKNEIQGGFEMSNGHSVTVSPIYTRPRVQKNVPPPRKHRYLTRVTKKSLQVKIVYRYRCVYIPLQRPKITKTPLISKPPCRQIPDKTNTDLIKSERGEQHALSVVAWKLGGEHGGSATALRACIGSSASG